MKHRIFDWIMERAVLVAAAVVALMIVGILFFLSWESRDAFTRKNPFGYRFALQPVKEELTDEVETDPNASLLTANPEGVDGVDEKEERQTISPNADLEGVQQLVTASDPSDDLTQLYRENWKPSQLATKGTQFNLYCYATPEYKEPTMKLAWIPDNDFDPAYSPYRLRLHLVQAPEGSNFTMKDIDLKDLAKGKIELPTFIAHSDEERIKGYIFRLVAEPKTSSNFLATLGGLFHSKWNPTAAYSKFGIAPLIYGTFIITLVALLIAVPLGVWTAIFLSEVAPSRLREWLKPIIELLASVPTVVLGYFGLMLVAPALVKLLESGFKMESGRSMLTAAIMMAVLILPTIASVAEDALRSVPGGLRDGADALGMSTSEMIRKIVLKAARPGLVGAALLGMARSIGETMIVWILAGGSPSLPQASSLAHAIVQPVRGIPDTIAVEMGNVEYGGAHYGHLFLLGAILFIVTIAINLAGYAYARRNRWQM